MPQGHQKEEEEEKEDDDDDVLWMILTETIENTNVLKLHSIIMIKNFINEKNKANANNYIC